MTRVRWMFWPRMLGWTINVRFEPRDIWVGVFWDRERDSLYGTKTFKAYICLVPCLPIFVARVVPFRTEG